jgi:hypothetical protein
LREKKCDALLPDRNPQSLRYVLLCLHTPDGEPEATPGVGLDRIPTTEVQDPADGGLLPRTAPIEAFVTTSGHKPVSNIRKPAAGSIRSSPIFFKLLNV